MFHRDADTVPIWALYDTLLLIGHLPLLNVNMPGTVVIFLTQLTKTLSFEFIALESTIINALNVSANNQNLGVLFYQAGYESVYVTVNLCRTFVILLFLLAVRVMFSCLDRSENCKIKRWSPNGRTEQPKNGLKCSDVLYNIATRIILCVFIIICVSIFINLQTVSQVILLSSANFRTSCRQTEMELSQRAR